MAAAAPGDLLPKLAPFKTTDPAAVRALLAIAPLVNFAADTIVYRQGEPIRPEALLVVTGRVRVFIEQGGARRNVGDIWPGEFIGEAGLFSGGDVRSANVVCGAPSACLLITRELLREHAGQPALVALEQHLTTVMVKRIRATNTLLLRAVKEPPPAAAPSAGRSERPRPRPAPAEALTLAQRVARWFNGTDG